MEIVRRFILNLLQYRLESLQIQHAGAGGHQIDEFGRVNTIQRRMDSVYAYASMGRTGLGNMLFAWARCEVFANRHQLPILAPQWTQPKIGPLLRGEKDLRYYTGLFSNAGYICGLRRLRLLLAGKRVVEDQAEPAFANRSRRGATIVTFRGMRRMFEPLIPHRELLRRRLGEILAEPIRASLDAQGPPDPIAIHVRRGDMNVVPFGEPYPVGICRALPIEWFVGCLRSVREAAGAELAATIYSDGREEVLEPLLSMPKTRLAAPNTSVADILLMSRSPILITTGSSTFSGWACFLGRPISLWYPESPRELLPVPMPGAVVTSLDGHVISDQPIDWPKETL